ncbi:hypothetical protein [Flavobacterium sp.]|uniref:hypothetical protein n=1 Tax=Flavobacterium sp. TaxID=239 RepID=UPI00286D115B|nr:hypothetical protein [Flavobacterium sp.]
MKQLLEIIKHKNEALFIYGIVCLLGAMVCMVLSKYSTTQVMGISAWIKPLKFLLSVTLFVWTMGFYLQYLENQKQVIFYSWSAITLFSIELILIIYQTAQSKMSHFNVETPLDKFIFNMMAVIITLLMLHTLYIALLFFNQNQFSAPETIILAVKLSIVVTVLFAFEGFAMGAILKHTVGSEDGSAGLPIINWSKNYGDLRVAHFFGIHALQMIPLLTYLLAKTKRDVLIIAFIYFVFVSYTLVNALQGKPFIKL